MFVSNLKITGTVTKKPTHKINECISGNTYLTSFSILHVNLRRRFVLNIEAWGETKALECINAIKKGDKVLIEGEFDIPKVKKGHKPKKERVYLHSFEIIKN